MIISTVGPAQRIPRIVSTKPAAPLFNGDFIQAQDTGTSSIGYSGAWQDIDTSASGDVQGPASATDNAVARYDGTTGKLIQNSVVIIADTTGLITGSQGITISGSTSGSVAIAATATGGQLTVGTGPTTITDAAGKILSAALNTVGAAQGGTGVANNAASTVAISGNFATTFTVTGITGVTLPTTGTLLTTTGSGTGLSGVTLSAIVPNTAPSSGQILAGNAGGTAYAPVSMGGDATLASTGALTLASTIVAGGPIGSATVAPIITYDAKGRLTTVSSATITPAVGSITGFGTGVGAALAINVGSAGAPVLFNGAGGTPSSIVLTNATGTAASFTAGTASAVAVGGITGLGTGVGTWLATPSSANLRAALTDENGTGVALFDGATTPTFTTGIQIGGAAASRKMLVGNGTNFVPSTETWAVPGTSGNVLTSDGTNWTSAAAGAAAAGTLTGTTLAANVVTTSITSVGVLTAHTVSGQLLLTNNGTQGFQIQPTTATNAAFGTYVSTGGTSYIGMENSASTALLTGSTAYALIIRPASGKVIQLGKGDGSAVTVTFSDTSVAIASTTDSTTTTSGALQVAGGAAIRKRVFIDGITASSGLQTAVLCQSSGGEMIADSVACLASSERFKEGVESLDTGLSAIMALRPVSYRYRQEGIFAKNKNFQHERIGLLAEEVARIDSRVVGFEADGKTPRTVGYEMIVPILIRGIQQQQATIEALNARFNTLWNTMNA